MNFKKVTLIASDQLARRQYVCGIDILLGLSYLSPNVLEDWRCGRISYLERQLQVNLVKLSFVMKSFRQWALSNGLLPRETAYVQKATSRTIHLRFSKSGQEDIERYYRTHYFTSINPAKTATFD